MWSRGRISLIGYHQRKVLSGYEDSVSLQQLRTAFYHSRYGHQFPISLYTRACLKYMPIYAIISYASSVALTPCAYSTHKCHNAQCNVIIIEDLGCIKMANKIRHWSLHLGAFLASLWNKLSSFSKLCLLCPDSLPASETAFFTSLNVNDWCSHLSDDCIDLFECIQS